MWWKPASEHEREVSEWLHYGSERFLSERERGQVWGIGSYISADGVQPLILLNEAIVDEPSPVPRLLPLRLLPASIREEFGRWEFPERTVFLAVTEPEPLSNSSTIPVAAGDVLRCPVTKEEGTIGPAIEGYNDNGNKFVGILTAGHVIRQGKGSSVEVVQQRRLLPPLYHLVRLFLVCLFPSPRSPGVRSSGGPGVRVSGGARFNRLLTR